MSDIKVRVPRGQRYYYPDVAVTCDALDADERTVHAPQEHRHVTRHWRYDAGRWWTDELWSDDVSFPSPPGAELTLDEIYRDG